LNKRFFTLALAAAAVLGLASPVHSQAAYPNKPIRFIVPWAPGGGGDTAARLVAESMSKTLGQNMLVDNKPGASGQIGIDMAAKAPADGYTIVFGSNGPLAVLPQFKTLPYDPFKDLTPIGMIVISDGIVVVNRDFPARTVKEFVDVLKASPGKYAYGSPSSGGASHLSGEMFQIVTGTKLMHIGYKGDGPALTELIGGQIPMIFTVMASVMPHVNAGTVRPIAVLGKKRSAMLPNVPSMFESGYPGMIAGSWFSIHAPAGTPAPVIERLSAALKAALSDPTITAKLATSGMEPAFMTPQETGAYVREEYMRFQKLVKERNIKLD
jgi:tripartite-type tricarboxylate transporter receptor subunit TctC